MVRLADEPTVGQMAHFDIADIDDWLAFRDVKSRGAGGLDGTLQTE